MFVWQLSSRPCHVRRPPPPRGPRGRASSGRRASRGRRDGSCCVSKLRCGRTEREGGAFRRAIKLHYRADVDQAPGQFREQRQSSGDAALPSQHQEFRLRKPDSLTSGRALRFVGVRRGCIAGRPSRRFSRSMLGDGMPVSRDTNILHCPRPPDCHERSPSRVGTELPSSRLMALLSRRNASLFSPFHRSKGVWPCCASKFGLAPASRRR